MNKHERSEEALNRIGTVFFGYVSRQMYRVVESDYLDSGQDLEDTGVYAAPKVHNSHALGNFPLIGGPW